MVGLDELGHLQNLARGFVHSFEKALRKASVELKCHEVAYTYC